MVWGISFLVVLCTLEIGGGGGGCVGVGTLVRYVSVPCNMKQFKGNLLFD